MNGHMFCRVLLQNLESAQKSICVIVYTVKSVLQKLQSVLRESFIVLDAEVESVFLVIKIQLRVTHGFTSSRREGSDSVINCISSFVCPQPPPPRIDILFMCSIRRECKRCVVSMDVMT